MGRRNEENGDLIREYAATAGVSERTAQRHRDGKKASWLAFLRQKQAKKAGTGQSGQSGSDLEKAREIESDCWKLFKRLVSASQYEEEPRVLAELARAVAHAKKAHVEAVEGVKQAEQESGLFVSKAVIREMQSALIPPLASAIDNLKQNIASDLTPANRHEFYQAWQRQITNFNKALSAIDNRVEQILNN